MSDEETAIVERKPIHSPLETLADIKRELEHICNSDAVSKETALSLTRLFHATETLMRHECTSRERALDNAIAAIERDRLENELDRFARKKTLEDMRT